MDFRCVFQNRQFDPRITGVEIEFTLLQKVIKLRHSSQQCGHGLLTQAQMDDVLVQIERALRP